MFVYYQSQRVIDTVSGPYGANFEKFYYISFSYTNVTQTNVQFLQRISSSRQKRPASETSPETEYRSFRRNYQTKCVTRA